MLISDDFTTMALGSGALVGLVCSYLGMFVVLRRIVFVGASLAQAASAGVALSALAHWPPALGAGLATVALVAGQVLLVPVIGVLSAGASKRIRHKHRTAASFLPHDVHVRTTIDLPDEIHVLAKRRARSDLRAADGNRWTRSNRCRGSCAGIWQTTEPRGRPPLRA